MDVEVAATCSTPDTARIIKTIRLTSDEDEIECNADKVKRLALKTRLLKLV
jgi:protein PhnA